METLAERVITNIERVIIGKRREIELALIPLFSQGHLLLDDVPGTGKTMLARSIARSFDVRFKRIQCTPDLRASDIIGVTVYDQKKRVFEFRPGPIHANIVLVDEINRAMPKTQSAFLEAMGEHQVTSEEGETHSLSDPFCVIATENPIEYEATFPLPEAQLDRFFMRLRLGYAGRAEEMEMLKRHRKHHPIHSLTPVADTEQLLETIHQIPDIHIEDAVVEYIVDIVRRTRDDERMILANSARGELDLQRAAQAKAFLEGKNYVNSKHVRALAIPVLAHRIIIDASHRQKGVTQDQVIRECVDAIPEPPL